MRVLGIETSCDETAIAIIEDGKGIIKNLVASQVKIHAPFYGIVPEFASRAHIENINPLLENLLNERIDAVTFTAGPGLIGSLLIGAVVAETIAYIQNLPIIGVNHLEAHMFSIFLEHDIEPNFICLIISGGHTELVLFREMGNYEVIGSTRDDAVGEAFDKVAKLLKLGYPGGPIIDKISSKGSPDSINFPRPYLWGGWDFSFSGLKTAVVYYVRKNPIRKKKDAYDIASAFQQSVIDVLVEKTFKASDEFGMNDIVVVGGVAANSKLRDRFKSESKKLGKRVYFPKKELCTDNAAMVACLGYYKLKKGAKGVSRADPDLEISNW